MLFALISLLPFKSPEISTEQEIVFQRFHILVEPIGAFLNVVKTTVYFDTICTGV